MNSFLQGKKTLTVPPLRPLAAAPRAALTSPASAPARPTPAEKCEGASPTVEVVKEGDKVVRLVVVCTCGERVEIECLYPGVG
ncbi:MAG TPA: hypothetical protein VEQ65_13660 [Opitutus sp.]|nr:hypothetical protein [Opitutus sp.]